MNYRLSCATNRVEGKNGFVLELSGREVEADVFKTEGDNIKENILETIYRGIRVARGVVKHEDILFIEVQNFHLCEWLSGLKEYKGYEEKLDKVFEVLESTDCRYRFVFVKNPYAKSYIKAHDVKGISGSSIADVMSEFV